MQLQIAAVKLVLWCHADITAHAIKQRLYQASAESEQQMTNPNWYTESQRNTAAATERGTHIVCLTFKTQVPSCLSNGVILELNKMT